MACMPWNEIDVITEKERFIALVHSGRFTTTELCADFGINRKTGHKYLKRYQLDGRKGLHDRSRRPKKSPLTTGRTGFFNRHRSMQRLFRPHRFLES